jgi:hypothetical protein
MNRNGFGAGSRLRYLCIEQKAARHFDILSKFTTFVFATRWL